MHKQVLVYVYLHVHKFTTCWVHLHLIICSLWHMEKGVDDPVITNEGLPQNPFLFLKKNALSR